MSDLEWLFTVDGNAKEALAQVDQVLAAMPKDLAKAEAGLKGLERALAAQNIAKINDPLRQNLAIAKEHARVLREEAAAAEKAAAAERSKATASQRETEATKRATEAMHAKAAEEAKRQSDAVGSSLANAFGVGNLLKITSVAGAIDLAAGAVKGLATSLGSGALELFRFGLEASQGKRAMLGMLQVFEGDRTDKAFGALQDMGIAAGQSADATVNAFAQLRSAGFKAKEAQDIIAASFDVAAARGGGEQGKAAADKFQELFLKFRAGGKVGSKDMLALARDVGVDPSKQLPEALAARMKVPVAAALKLLEAGKADAATVQNALLEIVQKDINKGGGLGTKAKELKAGDVLLQVQSLKDVVSNLFENVDVSPFAKALGNVSEAIKKVDGEGGRIGKIVDRLFALGGGIGDLDATSTIERAVEMFDAIVTDLETIKTAFSSTFDSKAFDQTLAALDRVDALMGGVGKKTDSAAAIGKVFGFVATQIAISAAALAKFIELEQRIVGSIAGTVSKVGAVAKNVGGGFADGIRTGDGGKVFDAAVTMATAPIKAVTGTLDIRSPSRVMDRLAGQTWEGWERGNERAAPSAGFEARVDAATSGGGGGKGSGPTGPRIQITFGDIIVQGAAAAVSDVRDAIYEGVLEALEAAGQA